VTSADQAAKKLAKKPAGGHLVRIQRRDGAAFVVIPNAGEG
jgi:hypothetical protein